jgi:hypothetical protein
VSVRSTARRVLRGIALLAVGVAIIVAAPAETSASPPSALSLGSASDQIFTLSANVRRAAKSYRLSVSVDSDPQIRPSVLLTLELSKTRGIATQLHDYTFQLPAFDCTPALSSCTVIRTRHLMDVYGQLALRFMPRGPRIARPVDFPTCTGQKSERRGTLVGMMWFKPHNAALPAYRGNFRLAALVTSEIYSCNPMTDNPATPFCPTSGLAGVSADTTEYFGFTQSSDGSAQGGFVHFGGTLKTRGWATFGHTLYYKQLPAGVMTAAPDLSTASVDGTSLPFLTGSLSYAYDGKPPLTQTTSCGGETQTGGLVSGDLTAHFDGLAPRLVAPMQAMLWRRHQP